MNNPNQLKQTICEIILQNVDYHEGRTMKKTLGSLSQKSSALLFQNLFSKEVSTFFASGEQNLDKLIQSSVTQGILTEIIIELSKQSSPLNLELCKYISKRTSKEKTLEVLNAFLSEERFQQTISRTICLIEKLLLENSRLSNCPDQLLSFESLKIHSYQEIPNSEGVLYEAACHIDNTNLMAISFRLKNKGSIALYDLVEKKVLSKLDNVHVKWINHLIWIEKAKRLVSCSNDKTLKVYSIRNCQIKLLKILRGHTDLVRCLVHINDLNLTVSGGDDPNLKIWNIWNLRLVAKISTHKNTNMDGSIAYIQRLKLVGVGFRNGEINFYHLLKRVQVFQIKTGFGNFYTYGLSYHPISKLIIGRVKEHTVKAWKFDEEKLKAEEYSSILTSANYPDCILANEKGDEILVTSRSCYVERIKLESKERIRIEIPEILKTNCVRHVDTLKKIFVGDFCSGKFCLLEL